MRRLLVSTVIALCTASNGALASQQGHAMLDIYFLDMVGGGSTLIVTPLGESVLIDTGSLEPKHRDADRMYQACRYAGLEHIDYLITTHFHSDHFGGILEFTEKIHYNTRSGDDGNTSGDLIANKEDPQKGELIKASVNPKKNTFTVAIGVMGPGKEFSIQ